MLKKYTTKNFKETQVLGEKLAKEIKNRKQAVVLGLQGNLGGGKTTFLQGFAKGLGIKEKVLSPTFVIMKRFKINIKHFKNFYHIDCYRLNGPKDIDELGIKDILLNPENIVAVEWSEKIKKRLPKLAIVIKFDFIDKNKREIFFKT